MLATMVDTINYNSSVYQVANTVYIPILDKLLEYGNLLKTSEASIQKQSFSNELGYLLKDTKILKEK